MARSPAHLWGQIIGGVFEAGVLPLLTEFAREKELFLDRKGKRPCRTGRKCPWEDSHGNKHDLDFVLERGGSPEKTGIPAAFIETAWRRYTKHSRNKAQEIQGAIMPLAETYANAAPFKGAILAGLFTEGAKTQLRSLGFTLLHFPYEMIVRVFQTYGIDASSEENTPDAVFQEKVDRFRRLTTRQLCSLPQDLMKANAKAVRQFMDSLAKSVSRRIERIIVLPLHGMARELATIEEAISFVNGDDDAGALQPLQRYEIQIRYNNGDAIEGKFGDKDRAVEFLLSYRLPAQG